MFSSLLFSHTISFNHSQCKPIPTSTTKPFVTKQVFNTRTNQTHGFKVSCKVAQNKNNDNDKENQLILPETQNNLILPNVDRRNILLGVGGLCTSVNFTSLSPAFAFQSIDKAIRTDFLTCKNDEYLETGIKDTKSAVRTRKCCPPAYDKNIEDHIPVKGNKVRMRWPAHRGSKENIEKYKLAIAEMRKLDDDDPRSFVQQATVHCAYCNGGYVDQYGKELQIHNSWLFFPFHRWYLYFYERILGKLINDDTFALPYWNWDNPNGMLIPDIFEGKFDKDKDGNKVPNSIFDPYRNVTHLPPTIVDLEYSGNESNASCVQQIGCNLSSMYRQMSSNAPDATRFFGGKYNTDSIGSDVDVAVGSIEAGCHTAVHRWVGNPRMPNNEDMGNFYSAGYDPLFYVHHANVDRMWKLWKRGNLVGHQDHTDPDWLNTSFVFYDENKELVRVYNRDSRDLENLNYDYEDSQLSWLRPVPRNKNKKTKLDTTGEKKVEDLKFPLRLNDTIKFLVKRPKELIQKTPYDVKKMPRPTELLTIRGIEFVTSQNVKFDVFVNDPEDGIIGTACDEEFVGSFAQIKTKDHVMTKTAISFGLTDLLTSSGALGDEAVLVKIVPKEGTENLFISGIDITNLVIPA